MGGRCDTGPRQLGIPVAGTCGPMLAITELNCISPSASRKRERKLNDGRSTALPSRDTRTGRIAGR